MDVKAELIPRVFVVLILCEWKPGRCDEALDTELMHFSHITLSFEAKPLSEPCNDELN